MKNSRSLLLSAVALVLIWFFLSDQQDRQQTQSSATAAPSVTNPPTAPAAAPLTAAVLTAPASAAAAASLPPLPKTTAELNAFADGPLPLSDKMRVLTAMMLGGSPADAKAAAVRALHLVNNADYNTHLLPLVLEAAVKPEALEVLGLNLYDRPLDLLLPAWAQIRERPDHPLHAAAGDGLEFHLRDKAAATGPDLAKIIRDHFNPARN